MRYFMPWPGAGRRPGGAHTVARLLTVATAAVALAGCSWITGVPNVARVRVTATPTTISARGQGAQIVGEAYDGSGGLINHRRRIVQFHSADPAIATVSGAGTGTVLGLSPGVVWIIGESGGKKDSVQITVGPEQPAIIQIAPTFPRVPVGGTLTVAVNALSASGQALATYTVTCESSAPTVVQAAGQGKTCVLNGLAQGSATLLVKVNGASQQTFPVSVETETPTKVIPQIRTPIRVGEQLAIVPRLERADGTVIPSGNRSYTYTSSDNSVATVDVGGVLTARREGTATITVTTNNVTGTQVVQVTQVPVVTLLLPANPVFRVDAPNGLRIIPLDSLRNELSTTGRVVKYVSADESILSISPTGVFTGKKPGTVKVTVTVDNVTESTTAVVTPMPVGGIAVDSQRVERNPGGTFQYTATVLDSLGRRLTDRQVTWSSSNSSIVSVDATTGAARAITVGQVGITATVVRVPGFPGTVENTGQFTVFATPVARVEASPTSVSVARGATTIVSLVARDASGTQLFNRPITAISDNPAVAIADGSGAIRGVGSGTTTIRFQALDAASQPQGAPAEVTVTVP
jgi:uncharacterized protein YjdB